MWLNILKSHNGDFNQWGIASLSHSFCPILQLPIKENWKGIARGKWEVNNIKF